MEKYDYQFNLGALDQFECNGIALKEILKTNNFLLRLLKNYSQFTQIQVNQQTKTGEGKEAAETLRNLGLLLWNYIFSTNAENKAIEKLEKIYSSRNSQHGTDNTFVLWFKKENEKIRFESLPWELLFWPDPISPDENGQFLFNLKKNRIIRQGNPLDNGFESKILPTLPQNDQVKILFVVLGYPEDGEKPESYVERHFYDPPLSEKEKLENWNPLSYLTLKDELLSLCTGVNSEMRILVNGKSKETFINGKPAQEEDHPEFITFPSLRDEITAFRPHIIHLITHGRCEPQSGKLELVINSNEYQLKPEWDKTLSDNLVGLFNSNDWAGQNKPKVIYLEICQSGQSTFPLKLSEVGIGAILAMFYDINQLISQNIAGKFYHHMLSEDFLEILEAFHTARQYSWEKFEKNHLGFGLPVIYYNYDYDAPLIDKNHLIQNPVKIIKKTITMYIKGIFDLTIQSQARLPSENDKAVTFKKEIKALIDRKYLYGENVEELVFSSLEALKNDNEVKKTWPAACKVIEEYLIENSSNFQGESKAEKKSSSNQDNAMTSQFRPNTLPNRH